MATLPPGLPHQPWQCPRCRAQWHSGTQHCADCEIRLPDGRWVYPEQLTSLLPPQQPGAVMGNGQAALVGPNGHPLSPQAPSLLAPPPSAPSTTEAEYPELFQQIQKRDLEQHSVAHEITEDLQAQLERSISAESALQAEVTPLRERVLQLEAQLQQQRQQLLSGMQAMLEPLAQELLRQGHKQLQLSQLIPVAVEVLQALKQTQAPTVLQTIAEKVEVLLQLVQRPAPVPLPVEEPTGTFLMTDRGAYELEQALLREQQVRPGGIAYG